SSTVSISSIAVFLCLMMARHPRSTLVPYTTLFRSRGYAKFILAADDRPHLRASKRKHSCVSPVPLCRLESHVVLQPVDTRTPPSKNHPQQANSSHAQVAPTNQHIQYQYWATPATHDDQPGH